MGVWFVWCVWMCGVCGCVDVWCVWMCVNDSIFYDETNQQIFKHCEQEHQKTE